MWSKVVGVVLAFLALTVLASYIAFYYLHTTSPLPIWVDFYATPCLALLALIVGLAHFCGLLTYSKTPNRVQFGIADILIFTGLVGYTVGFFIWCFQTDTM